MILKTTDILNGKIRLHSVQTDKFKATRFSVNFICERDEYYSPLARLMLQVMMRGSESYPTVIAINKALDERYGATVSVRSSVVGDKSVHKISCKMLKDKYAFADDDTDIFDGVMSVLSDILFHPLKDNRGLLCEAFVESEKKIAIDHLNAKKNDLKAYASEQCSKNMFKDSKYGVAIDGNVELIRSFTSEDLTENISRFFQECRIECFYIGDEDHSKVQRLIKKYFVLENPEKYDISYGEKPFERKGNDVKYIQEEEDVSQGRLVLGYRCGTVLSDSEYYSMLLFNEMFGGASVSKLFLNLRERKSLCYYCYSSLHSATGTVKVGCGIDPAKKDDAQNEIAFQLSAMQNGDFTDSEIETAKHTLIASFRQINDSPASIEAFLLRRIFAGVCEEPQICCEKIAAVSRDEVIAAANRMKLDTVYFLNGNGDGEEDAEDE